VHLGGIAAVVGEVGRLPMVAGRRLQLAAERSGVTALVLRRWRTGAQAERPNAQRPSAALTRWRVAALPSLYPDPKPRARTQAVGLYRDGRAGGSSCCAAAAQSRRLGCVPWNVEVADATGLVSLSAELADRPAAPRLACCRTGLEKAAGSNTVPPRRRRRRVSRPSPR
jgi:protein ImuA